MEKTVDMKSDLYIHFLKHIFELQHGPLKNPWKMSSLAKFTTKNRPEEQCPPGGFHETYLKGHHRHHPAQG